MEATILEDGWIVLKERIDMTMTSNEIRLEAFSPSGEGAYLIDLGSAVMNEVTLSTGWCKQGGKDKSYVNNIGRLPSWECWWLEIRSIAQGR